MNKLSALDQCYPDRRRMRAHALTSQLMHIISPYICEHDERNLKSELGRKLLDIFYTEGHYVLTDLDRATAGLPLRNDYGWTENELQILEWAQLEAMRRPFIVPADLVSK